MASSWGTSWGTSWADSWGVVGGAGAVVVFFSGISRVDGVTQHQGISRPTLVLTDAGGGTYNVTKTHQIHAENAGAISDTTYLIDGLLP